LEGDVHGFIQIIPSVIFNAQKTHNFVRITETGTKSSVVSEGHGASCGSQVSQGPVLWLG
jgi:hypothetical protein